jgi:lipopolysaccharide export system protein LptA
MKAFHALAAALAVALIAASAPGAAATKPAPPPPSPGASKPPGPPALLPGSNSKEPISIEADKLVYFDKEQKAIYTGNVVVIQGDTKMTCSAMTIYMEKGPEAGQPDAAKPGAPAKPGEVASAAPSGGASRVKHLDAVGPVTVLSKTQVATGDSAAYDKAQNKVWLIGNVTLSDGGNVTKGDKLTYDMATGEATVETGPAAARVKGLFIPASGASPGDDKTKAASGDDKTKTAK